MWVYGWFGEEGGGEWWWFLVMVWNGLELYFVNGDPEIKVITFEDPAGFGDTQSGILECPKQCIAV